ncbi:MAG: methyl-accepting chemotaxis protein [Spirochaeta sp.]
MNINRRIQVTTVISAGIALFAAAASLLLVYSVSISDEIQGSIALQNTVLLYIAVILIIAVFSFFSLKRFAGIWRRVSGFNPEQGEERTGAIPADEVSDMYTRSTACRRRIDEMLKQAATAAERLFGDDRFTIAAGASSEVDISDSTIPQLPDRILSETSSVVSGISRITSAAGSLKKHMQQQTAEVNTSDQNHSRMLDAVRNAVQVSYSIDHRLHEVHRLLQGGNAAVVHTVEEMRSVESDIRGILDIIPIINTLAERTSLLSMNASIESAHAAENGLGFAVVAEEIGKLAVQSGENAEVIAESLHRTVERVQTALESSESSSAVFDNLRTTVDEFTSAIAEITTSLSELSEGMLEINRAVQEVVEATLIIERLTATMQDSSMSLGTSLESGIQAIEGVSSAVHQIQESSGEAVQHRRSIFEHARQRDKAGKELAHLLQDYGLTKNHATSS